MTPFYKFLTSCYLSSIMALSCIVSEIKLDIGRKSWFFIPPSTKPFVETVANIFALFLLQSSQFSGLPSGLNRFSKSPLFTHSTPVLQTDRQTDGKMISIAEHLLRNARCNDISTLTHRPCLPTSDTNIISMLVSWLNLVQWRGFGALGTSSQR